MLSSASALTSCSMRSGNWHYVVEELLLRDRERLEDVHGEDTLEKSQNIITATILEYFLIQLRNVCKKKLKFVKV